MVLVEVRRGCQIPGPGVKDGSELPCGCCDSNLSPLQEQHVFLTTEPPLQLQPQKIMMAMIKQYSQASRVTIACDPRTRRAKHKDHSRPDRVQTELEDRKGNYRLSQAEGWQCSLVTEPSRGRAPGSASSAVTTQRKTLPANHQFLMLKFRVDPRRVKVLVTKPMSRLQLLGPTWLDKELSESCPLTSR